MLKNLAISLIFHNFVGVNQALDITVKSDNMELIFLLLFFAVFGKGFGNAMRHSSDDWHPDR